MTPAQESRSPITVGMLARLAGPPRTNMAPRPDGRWSVLLRGREFCSTADAGLALRLVDALNRPRRAV